MRRESRRYLLRFKGKHLAPKLVLGRAHLYARGTELRPDAFSGGAETNEILAGLGFEIVPLHLAGAPSKPLARRRSAREPQVATVLIERSGDFDLRKCLSATDGVLTEVARATKGEVVLPFPGGWLKAGQQRPGRTLERVERQLRKLLRAQGGRLAMTFGIDGRDSKDQLAVAMNEDGIVGMGRKFFPTKDEKDDIEAAADFAAGEGEHPRIAQLFGRRFYLVVCYDGFGIKKLSGPKPGVDAVLDHIHGFGAVGSGGSGDVLFARHGLAGASQRWGVPVFGSAHFDDRCVPPDWPSGVLWKGRKQSTMKWTYAKNGIAPTGTLAFPTSCGRAVVRVFAPFR